MAYRVGREMLLLRGPDHYQPVHLIQTDKLLQSKGNMLDTNHMIRNFLKLYVPKIKDMGPSFAAYIYCFYNKTLYHVIQIMISFSVKNVISYLEHGNPKQNLHQRNLSITDF